MAYFMCLWRHSLRLEKFEEEIYFQKCFSSVKWSPCHQFLSYRFETSIFRICNEFPVHWYLFCKKEVSGRGRKPLKGGNVLTAGKAKNGRLGHSHCDGRFCSRRTNLGRAGVGLLIKTFFRISIVRPLAFMAIIMSTPPSSPRLVGAG